MISLMLDSGAFTSWRLGEVIDLDRYIEYIHRHRESILVPINLDKIPGKPRTKPTLEDVEDSARVGFDNFLYMRKRGVESMPVFHQGESFEWLDRILESEPEWLGISPRNDYPTKRKLPWLDQVFGHICGDRGYPSVRCHGFGITAISAVLRYPWATVDSLSWLLSASLGTCTFPTQKVDGTWDYLHSRTVGFSERDEKQRAKGSSWTALPPQVQSVYRAYIKELEDVLDLDIPTQDLIDNYVYRDVVNLCFYLRATQGLRVPYTRPSPGFHAASTRHGSSRPVHGPVTVYFTSTEAVTHNWALNRCGVKNRLCSYYSFNGGKKDFDLGIYVKTGSIYEGYNRLQPTDRQEEPVRGSVFDSGRVSF